MSFMSTYVICYVVYFKLILALYIRYSINLSFSEKTLDIYFASYLFKATDILALFKKNIMLQVYTKSN